MNELTKQTPGIDEQISRQREVIRHCEGKAGINIEGDKAILTTLLEFKQMKDAVMPEEPVIIKIWRGLQNKTVPQQEIIDHIDTLSAVAMKNAEDAKRYHYAQKHLRVGEVLRDSMAECSCDFVDMDDAALASGVREGMLRAAEICKGILVECLKNKKERGDHAVIAMCREAITRAASQVNAEGRSVDEYLKKVESGYVFKVRG